VRGSTRNISLNTSRKALRKALVREYISAEEVLGPESTC
jgi:hypothetical protein